jgi:hypothetical protein
MTQRSSGARGIKDLSQLEGSELVNRGRAEAHDEHPVE